LSGGDTGTRADNQQSHEGEKSTLTTVHESTPPNGETAGGSVNASLQSSAFAAFRDLEANAVRSVERSEGAGNAREGEPGGVPIVGQGRAELLGPLGPSPAANDRNPSGYHTLADDLLVGLSFSEAPAQDLAANPQAADLITSAPRLDVDALQAGVQSFLHDLDHLGRSLLSSPEGLGLSFWALSVLAVTGVCELARRQKRRPSLGLVAVTDEPMFAWRSDEDEGPDESVA
jgi:hypothetical protein